MSNFGIDARFVKDTDGKDLNSVNEQLDDIAKCKFYFAPVLPTTNPDSASGDCSLIVTETGKNILVDTGSSNNYTVIKPYLDSLGIKKIDYFIASHYHDDHVGNLSSMMTDYDFNTCIAYLPKDMNYTNGGFDVHQAYLTVTGLLANNTKYFPNSGDTLTVDDITLTFFNCNQADLDYYAAESGDNYNSMSLCFELTHRNIKALFPGDIGADAQSRLYTQGYINKIDLLKFPHHGFNRDVNSDFIRTIQPKYSTISQSIISAISTGQAGDNSTDTMNSNLKSVATAYLSSIGCEMFTLGYTGAVEIVSDGFSIENASDTKSETRAINSALFPIMIYVDKSTTVTNSDGTINRPYRKIQEAISFCASIPNQRFTISIANGDYGEDLVISSNVSKFTLLGNTSDNTQVKIDSLTTYDARVILNSININGTRNIVAAINDSHVELDNCLIDGVPTSRTNYTDGRGLCAYNSHVYINGGAISHKSAAICSYNGSSISVNALGGTDNNYAYVPFTGDITSIGATLTVNKAWLVKANGKYSGDGESGASTSRLVFVDSQTTGLVRYWDTTINEEMLWTGTKWVDNDGYGRDVQLATGNDLNTFTTRGKFLCSSGSIATSLLNAPASLKGTSFELVVKVDLLGTAQFIRTSVAVGNTGETVGLIWRTYKDSAWTAWQELSQTAH